MRRNSGLTRSIRKGQATPEGWKMFLKTGTKHTRAESMAEWNQNMLQPHVPWPAVVLEGWKFPRKRDIIPHYLNIYYVICSDFPRFGTFLGTAPGPDSRRVNPLDGSNQRGRREGRRTSIPINIYNTRQAGWMAGWLAGRQRNSAREYTQQGPASPHGGHFHGGKSKKHA